MDKIQMVDLVSQYQNIKEEVDQAVLDVMSSAKFIKGPQVANFEKSLSSYLGVKHTIGCANGTDALQIALMALELQPGDEVIVPSFTYAAPAEVVALLGLTPVFVDVDLNTFNVTANLIESAITKKTKAIIPVHLYGQSCDMEEIMAIAQKHNLYVIEDNAQAIGCKYTFKDGTSKATGTIGDIGITSFFPSKNLGCFGDGGAIFTNSDQLAEKLKMIASHGQSRKYHHFIIGVNSRLDTIQAAILQVKLKYLKKYNSARQRVAERYNQAFSTLSHHIKLPEKQSNSTHIYHQYTLQILNKKRDELKEYLTQKGVPSVVYYPIPVHKQKAYKSFHYNRNLPHTGQLCESVLSLPIHTEMKVEVQEYITKTIVDFFEKNQNPEKL